MSIQFVANEPNELLVNYPKYRSSEVALCSLSTGIELCSSLFGKQLISELHKIVFPYVSNLKSLPLETLQQFAKQHNLTVLVKEYAENCFRKIQINERLQRLYTTVSILMQTNSAYLGMLVAVIYKISNIVELDFNTLDYIDYEQPIPLDQKIRSYLRDHGSIIANGFFSTPYYSKPASPSSIFRGKQVYQHPVGSRIEIKQALFPHSILIVGMQKIPRKKTVIYYLDPTMDNIDSKRGAGHLEPKLRAMSFNLFMKSLCGTPPLLTGVGNDFADPDDMFSHKTGDFVGFFSPPPYLFAAKDYGLLQASLAAGSDGYIVVASAAAAAANPAQSCAARCDKLGVSQCGRCRAVYYCSEACQRVHWPTHKLSCAAKPT